MLRVLGLALLLSWLGVPVVFAQETPAIRTPLTAQGDGVIAFNGQGEIRISGSGMLFIVDRTGEIEITIQSERRLRRDRKMVRGNTVYTYQHFNGEATISGDDIAILIDGKNLNLTINGAGMILMDGVGYYQLDDYTHDWGEYGVQIQFDLMNP